MPFSSLYSLRVKGAYTVLLAVVHEGSRVAYSLLPLLKRVEESCTVLLTVTLEALEAMQVVPLLG